MSVIDSVYEYSLSVQRFIYPFGNSSPQSLIPLSLENIDNNNNPYSILSLGCGDCRDILFSIQQYHQSFPSSSSSSPPPPLLIHYTCVDIESSIHARNIALLHSISSLNKTNNNDDPQAVSSLFSLYYDQFITIPTLKLLKTVVNNILSSLFSSENKENREEKSGIFSFDFCDISSFQSVQSIFEGYKALIQIIEEKEKKEENRQIINRLLAEKKKRDAYWLIE